MSQHDHELERRARDLYQRASRDVDPTTAGRLRAARRTALAAPHASPVRRVLIPASAFAMVALASLMVWQPGTRPAATPPTAIQSAETDASSDLPPDADSTDPTMYQDMQFYSWLAYNDGQRSNK